MRFGNSQLVDGEFVKGEDIKSIWSNSRNYGVYFRKSFSLQNTSIDSSFIYSASDDDHEVYINGVKVASEYNGSEGPTLATDIKLYLQSGDNVIAVYAQNSAGGCQWLFVLAEIKFSNTCTDSDSDGVPDQWDTCPDTPTNSWVNKSGCPASGFYTEEQMNQMVEAILTWGDTDGDKKITLIEAIQALRVTLGVTEPAIKCPRR